MATMTATQADALWAAIDDQRERTADMLERLTDEQWEHPSLCDGWTVRHVATHLTLQRQHLSDVVAFFWRNPGLLRSVTLNRMIHDGAVLRARQLETDEIIDLIRVGIGSRRHNFFIPPQETLADILVHSQDIAIPLGIDLGMAPAACEIAATRRWDSRGSWVSSVFRRLPLDGCRLSATDVDWTRGQGAEITGPIGALLLLLAGRPVALDRLAGAGAETLRSALDAGR